MKIKKVMVDGVERTVRIFRTSEWVGFKGDDDMIHCGPDSYMLKRGGVLHIYDDMEYAKEAQGA